MSVKLLTEHHLEFLSLKGGCSGSLESTLVKMPHCWKSHVMALMIDAMINLLANTQDFGTYCIYMCKNLASIAHAAVSSGGRCLNFDLSHSFR